jgi:ATP-dependent helicase HrpB
VQSPSPASDLDLPVRGVLPAVMSALAAAGAAVLVAPPGTGKTTLVPLVLAGLIDPVTARPRPAGPAVAGTVAGAVAGAVVGAVAGTRVMRVVVTEPRRLAARAAAARIAALLGERVGERVGLTVRGESRTGPATRIEVVTTGVLVQRLHRDPELPGIAAIMLDECHERQLETDLALAFAVDVRAALRPDLLLLATSASVESARIATALGQACPAPVIEADGALHDVRIVWCPPPAGITPASGLRVDPRLLDHVAAVVRRALTETAGDVLAFLPGAGEIEAVTRRLHGLPDVRILPLHGRLSTAAQDAALRPIAGHRRVVLTTAVAESSLTVPGVRVVVDAGLSRVPRTDLARGLGSLVTVRASRAAATQRAGRAGRVAPGAAYRCWPASEHDRRPAWPEPEVATADLTAFALHLACWGAPGGQGLALLDPPPPAALEVAAATLRDLGAVDGAGRVTDRGRALASIGAHPRLARALLDGAAVVGARRAAEVVALLSDDGPLTGIDDLGATLRSLRAGRDRAPSARWRQETQRLLRAAGAGSGPSRRLPHGPPHDPSAGPPHDPPLDPPDHLPDDLAAATVVGLAFPERLARLRRPDGRTYLMASGTAAELSDGSPLTGAPWLAVAVADRAPGRRDARIRAAVPADEATARAIGEPLLARGPQVRWADGDVRARDVERLGAIVLTERPLPLPDPALVAKAVAEGLRQEGLGLLRWTATAVQLRRRLAACHAGLGPPWPAMDDATLLARLDLSTARSRSGLQRLDVAAALRGMLGWQLAARLDDVAPERIEVPTGSRIAVDYTDPHAPALPVKVQEVFGWTAAPQVTGRPLRLRLLSPAGQPVAVTSDLESFWRNGYPAVRAQLRGRYQRHPWPEDPRTAPPTRRANPRR